MLKTRVKQDYTKSKGETKFNNDNEVEVEAS